MSGGLGRLKSSPGSFFVASKPGLLPAFISRAGEGVLAHEQVAGAEGGRAFEQEHGAQRGQRRGEPRPMKLPVFSDRPAGLRKGETPGQFLRRGGDVCILHPARVSEQRCEQPGRGGERGGVRRGVEFIEEVRQAAVKGIPLRGE